MAAVTEARVRELINEMFQQHELALYDLMSTADLSVRQIQQEASDTRAALTDSNERAQAIYNKVQAARAEFDEMRQRIEHSTTAKLQTSTHETPSIWSS